MIDSKPVLPVADCNTTPEARALFSVKSTACAAGVVAASVYVNVTVPVVGLFVLLMLSLLVAASVMFFTVALLPSAMRLMFTLTAPTESCMSKIMLVDVASKRRFNVSIPLKSGEISATPLSLGLPNTPFNTSAVPAPVKTSSFCKELIKFVPPGTYTWFALNTVAVATSAMLVRLNAAPVLVASASNAASWLPAVCAYTTDALT